jgi:hypothetical protein
VDGGLQFGGGHADVVHPSPVGRGNSVVAPLQGTSAPVLRAATPVRPAGRVGGVSAHRHGRRVSGPVPGALAARQPPQRRAADPAVHGRSPTAAQHRRADLEPAVPRCRHELGPAVRAAGAVRRPGTQGCTSAVVARAASSPGLASTADGTQDGHR